MLCHVNSNFDYLVTDSLCGISFPEDVTLPYTKSEYEIPNVVMTDDDVRFKVGKNLNICPPNVVY